MSGGSTGFANMSRKTLLNVVSYIERHYPKPIIPDDVRYRIFGRDQDTRVSGDDYRSDLYYASAHLRELVDRITGNPCHNGELTREQFRLVIRAYNGSGHLAEKYANDAMDLLDKAKIGERILYFYEK